MYVICKKSTTRIVKGVTYEVVALWNSTTANYKEVLLKDFGRFSVKNFTTVDGKPLPEIDIPLPTNYYQTDKLLAPDDVKAGDIIVCRHNRYKCLVENGMYKVESITTKSTPRTYFNGATRQPYVEHFIKFVGIKRKLKFNGWVFRKLSTLEARELALNQVLFDEDSGVITTNDLRKIDLVKDKNLELMKIISKSILDPNRHALKIVDWGIQQVSKKIDVNVDDYKDLLKMSLEEVLELIETN